MSKIPTAEELLIEEAKCFSSPLTADALQLLVINVANKHALNHTKAALKAAADKAKVVDDPYSYCGNTGSEYPPDQVVDKDSILNAYPESNIK